MKRASSFLSFLLILAAFGGCAHREIAKKKDISEYSPEELERIQEQALALTSKRLEELVIKAKATETTSQYLATDLFLKGNMALLEGDFQTASLLFKHLVFLVPNDEFLQKKFAVALIRTGDLQGAEEVLAKLYKNSREEKVGLILAGVYTGVDKEKEAQKVYREILVKNPRNEDACIFLGKSLALAKEYSKAEKELHKCARKNPKNGMYDFFVGKIRLEQGKIPQGMESLRLALKRQPNHSQAINTLGILLEEKDKSEEAIKLYKNYLSKNPTDSAVLNRMVQVLFLKERFAEVIPYAERLSDLEPDNLNLKVKLGILYTDNKKYPEAVSVFKDLLITAPNSDKILYYLGAIYQEMQEYQSSIEYFNQIPSSSGLYTDSSIQMANMLSTLAQIEHLEKKEDTLQKQFLHIVDTRIKDLKDMKVEFSVLKSGFYEAIGNNTEALKAMAVVKDEANFSLQHKYYLANLYEKEKKYEESTSIIMGILEKEPHNAHAWNFLGYSILERGEDMDKAYEYIQKALKLSPEDGYIRDSLGWYYFKQGKVAKALTELEMAFKKVPDDIEILKHLAIIHMELKDFSKAKGYLKSALKHVRHEAHRQEIITQIEQMSDRIPASEKID